MAPQRLSIDAAVECIRAGGVVVFPIEGRYVLGCRAADAAAAARVVAIKGRPKGKPLPVLIDSARTLRRALPELPLAALAEHFWPGPLTLVVPAFPGLSAPVTAGTNMVGVRSSAHPLAQALVEALGEPLVATSANRSGVPAARSAADCDAAGFEGVDGLVDGGPLVAGASTVVGMVSGALRFFAEGGVPAAAVEAVWSRIRYVE